MFFPNRFKFVLLSFGFVLTFAAMARGGTVITSVDSHAGPWDFNAVLNVGFEYGEPDGRISPTVVDVLDGIDFTPGGIITITYLDGFTNAFGSDPLLNVDADGYPGFAFDDIPGSTGNGAPSQHMDPANYPTYLNQLVATFADALGAIVGTPFEVGNGPASFTIPVGATQLQLGINDDFFEDNTGALRIEVSGPDIPGGAVPEPGSLIAWSLIALSLGAITLAKRQRLSRNLR